MDYRSKTNLERARKEREKRTKKTLLIALIALLAIVLIVSVFIIVKDANAGGPGTNPDPGTSAVPTEGGDPTATPTGTAGEDPTGEPTDAPTDPQSAATDPQGPDVTGGEVTGEPPAPGYKNMEYKTEDITSLGYLLLVNNSTKFDILDKMKTKLVGIYENRSNFKTEGVPCSFKMSNTEPKINAYVMTAINQLFDACYAATNDNMTYISGAFRDYADQQKLFDNYPTTATKPGYSEYHTGYAFSIKYFVNYSTAANADMDYPDAIPVRDWLLANCYKYGFIRRYPPDKDSKTGIATDRYHFRYVGVPHSYYMYKNNLCLEEYLQMILTYEFSDRHLAFEDENGAHYEIYYVPASMGTTIVPVPTNCYYTVEGNNYSGFIVTAYLDKPAA